MLGEDGEVRTNTFAWLLRCWCSYDLMILMIPKMIPHAGGSADIGPEPLLSIMYNTNLGDVHILYKVLHSFRTLNKSQQDPPTLRRVGSVLES